VGRLHLLRGRLLERIDPEQDSLRIYRIREPIEENRKEHGCFKAIDFDKPLIV
jgi:CRISPR-associated protein Cas2